MVPPSGEGTEDDRSERRIDACLAACKGIPTEKLEKDILLRLIAACFRATDPEIRHVLEDLASPAASPKRARKPGRSQPTA